MSSKTAQQDVMKPWKQSLLEVDSLLQKQKKAAYEVAIRLSAVWEDPDFQASPQFADQLEAIRFLDGYAGQLFVIIEEGRSPFMDLLAMLETFRSAAEWREHSLSSMYTAVLDEAERRDNRASRKKRRTATLAEIDDLKRQLAAAKRQIAKLKHEIRELKSQRTRALPAAV